MSGNELILPEQRRQPVATIPKDQDATGMLAIIAQAARDPSMDLDKMERLVAMRDKELRRTAEIAFNEDFAAMQGAIPVVVKNGQIKVGNDVRSRFARFEDIDRVIKPILQQHGFALMFKTAFTDKAVTITATLRHRSGHSESTDFVAAADASGGKNAIQALASTVSYGKRQTAKALLNIAEGDEDDDGNSHGKAPTVSEEQMANLQALLEDVGANKTAFLAHLKVQALEDIPAKAYEYAVGVLNQKRKSTKAK